MKKTGCIILFLFLVSCTSNTIYERPKNLIPKDTMVAFLTDMYLASSAKNVKNRFLEKEANYVFLVYEKYKIDTARFTKSNIYYTSKGNEYSGILKRVKKNIDSLTVFCRKAKKLKDSLNLISQTKLKKEKTVKENSEVLKVNSEKKDIQKIRRK